MRTGELGTSSRIRNSNDMVRATVERLTEMLAHSWSLSNGAAVEFDHVTPPLFEPVLNAIETVVFIADTDGNLRYVNAAWERLTGFGQSDVGTLTQAYYLHQEIRTAGCAFSTPASATAKARPFSSCVS